MHQSLQRICARLQSYQQHPKLLESSWYLEITMALTRKTSIFLLRNVSFVLTVARHHKSLKLYENGVGFRAYLRQPLIFFDINQ